MSKSSPINFSEYGADELAAYITDHHHGFTRQSAEIIHDQLNQLTISGEYSKEDYRYLWNLFDLLFNELDRHMKKEETVLFPLIRKMMRVTQGKENQELLSNVEMRKPLALLLKEHHRIQLILQEIRIATDHYTARTNASVFCKDCLSEMSVVDQDIQKHFYIEENFLYPKLLSLEEKIGKKNTDN